MNKKKSKVLAFLLAASLLVPSTNGIVSAAELEKSNTENNTVLNNSNESVGNTDNQEENIIKVTSEEKLREAIKNANENQIIEIENDITLTSTLTSNVKGITIRGKEGKEKVSLTYGGKFIVIKNDTKIENLKFINTIEQVHNRFIEYGDIKLVIDNCEFEMAEGLKSFWTILYTGDTSDNKDKQLIFTNNKVNVNCRSCMVGVYNNAIIENNEIDLQNEHFLLNKESNSRTGIISLTAVSGGGRVSIKNNTFKNANRVIGFDNSTIEGEKVDIKKNIFKECRFAAEIGTTDNKGKNYDLSGNYFEHSQAGGVGPLKIQNANGKGDDFKYGSESNELIFNEDTDLSVAIGPYYTNSENLNENNMVNTGVATVDGMDYPTIESALKALKNNSIMELREDIVLTDTNTIQIKDKKVTITSAKNPENKKYAIGLNGLNTVCVEGTGHIVLENLNLKLMKSNQTYIQNKGAILEMNSCDVTANDGIQSKGNLIAGWDISDDINKNSKVLLNENDIKIHVRGIVSNVGNGSKIIKNKFDLCGEKFIYTDDQGKEKIERTGILTILGDGAEQIIIKENDFFNANRGIGLDHSTISGDKLLIKKNTFENVRFGAEINPSKNNKDKKYDFSGNYFYHKEAGGVGPMKIQDASKENESGKPPVFNNFSYVDGNGLETALLEFEDYKDQNLEENIEQWPYYKDKDCNHLSNESYIPSTPSKPVYTHEEIIGLDRYDTAAKIADKLGTYDTVVLVNATSTMSDGLSASGLAGKENGAILLTKKDSIPKVTMDRIKKVKKVYIIGGENAISAKVANEINAANIKVERLGGKTRVETSEIVAEKLGNYKDAFVVNGFKGEADAMSASAVAAKNKAPILLTNGKESTHDKKSGVKYYVIGGNNVVDKSIADKYSAEVLAGKDRYATNREVIDEFYSGSDKLYLANGDKLVDALTASPLAKKDGIVLVNEKSDKSILKGKNTVQVGGMDFEIKFEK